MKTIFTLIIIFSLSFNISAQWLPLSSGTDSNLQSIHFLDEDNGWVAGLDNFIHSTSDGGESWMNTGLHGFSTNRWYSIFALNSSEIYACGSTFNVDRWQSNWARTINGGSTWGFQSSWGNAYGSGKQVFFLNEDLGWKVGFDTPSGRLWRTTNGINGWDDYYSLDQNPYSVYFIDENYGWIGCQDGFVLRSSDGGETWSEVVTGITETLRSIFFINSSTGWAVGDDSDVSVIIKSTDGGATWNQIEHPEFISLSDVQFVNENIGWACGSKLESQQERGVILYTNDGGENWTEQYVSNQFSYFNSLFFIDGLTGWAVGYGGIMVKTINAGGTSFEGIDESSDKFMTSYSFPNPSSNIATIEYTLKQPETVTITVYNHIGSKVDYIQQQQSSGNQRVELNVDVLASGMYYYKLVAGEYVSSGNIIVSRLR